MAHKNIYTKKQRQTLLIASILLLLFFILFGLRDYLSALFGSVILYVLFLPMYRYLVEVKKWKPSLTSILIIVLSFVVIVLPFLFLSVLLTDKILYYTSHYQEILVWVKKMEEFSGFSLKDKETITSIASNLGSFLSNLFPQLVTGALDVFIILGLLYFVMYYLQVYNRSLNEHVYKYLPFASPTIKALTEELKASVNANVLGLGIISLVQATLVGISFWIFGVPDAIFWGLISFFAAFIPVLGTPLVWVPGGIYLISNNETGKGVGLLIVGAVVIMNIDNILRLYIAKKMGDTHPLITILGVILGLPLFGILGLVIGPLMISYLILLIKVYEQEYPRLHVPETTAQTDDSDE
ncbi:MAG TPA: AI-2E family transporter [Catalimonadaceae bacterium]|nr:AI-2E family transporter [Catalimonadaceae bacterium]